MFVKEKLLTLEKDECKWNEETKQLRQLLPDPTIDLVKFLKSCVEIPEKPVYSTNPILPR